MGWYILGGVAVILLIWVLATYNRFIQLRNNCEEGFATMDVFLKKRYDLIPNLVETVKGYAKHEAQTLESVIAARNAALSAGNMGERVNAENNLSNTLKSLIALGEAYPDLKANASFLSLQGDLRGVEADIANARKYYNAVVKSFNIACETVPSNIIARLFGFKKMTMFEADNESRENVAVKF